MSFSHNGLAYTLSELNPGGIYPNPQTPGAMQALMFAKEIYGDGSIELTPAYLILAEANLGQCTIKQHSGSAGPDGVAVFWAGGAGQDSGSSSKPRSSWLWPTGASSTPPTAGQTKRSAIC
jgi:hypothetical protein